MIWGPTPIFGNIHVFSTTIKALISIEASALSLGAAAEPKGHSSQGSAPSPRRLVGGLSWFLPMLAMKFANQPYLTQQKLGQLAHCCWISCWISRMLHPFTSTISRSPPVPFTLSAPASVALPLPVPLVPWHGSPVRKEISYGFGSLFRSLWQQLCYFTTIQLYIYIPITRQILGQFLSWHFVSHQRTSASPLARNSPTCASLEAETLPGIEA